VSGLIGTPAMRARRSTTLTAGLQCERRQQFGRAVGATGIASQCAIETLGKDLARASWYVAEPASAVDPQMDRLLAPRQIERVPLIPAVLTSAELTALRTRNARTRWFDNKDPTPVVLDDDQNDAPAFQHCPQRLGHRDSPSTAALAFVVIPEECCQDAPQRTGSNLTRPFAPDVQGVPRHWHLGQDTGIGANGTCSRSCPLTTPVPMR
jgi:hypothetical protein